MSTYDMEDKASRSDIWFDRAVQHIRHHLRAPDAVVTTTERGGPLDGRGADYIVRFPGERPSRHFAVDLKTAEKARKPGFYINGPDGPLLPLETYSVLPQGRSEGKIGWTLNQYALTDFVLYLFHPADTLEGFWLPFHPLRETFMDKLASGEWDEWKNKMDQSSGSWGSRCYLVPAGIVCAAVLKSFAYRPD